MMGRSGMTGPRQVCETPILFELKRSSEMAEPFPSGFEARACYGVPHPRVDMYWLRWLGVLIIYMMIFGGWIPPLRRLPA